MFRKIYLNLKRNLHVKLSEFYSTWILEHPVITILSYLILFICFALGLFHIQLYAHSSESLTYVKNSEYLHNSQRIKETFYQDPAIRYFQHQLTDLGYYAEYIVRLKNTIHGQLYNSSYNFVNQTILNEFNQFYDDLFDLTIQHNNKNLSYYDFCPKRLHKCAIEGSIIRNPVFQSVLLKKEAKYDKFDHSGVYIDPNLLDGTSFDFAFGKERKQRCNKKECSITQVGMIRIRFDFLSTNSTEIELALKYMNRFVDYLDELSQNDSKYKYIQFSYHTSHTLEAEIAKYSAIDLKYVGIAFIFFWFIYFLIILFEFEKIDLRKIYLNLTQMNEASSERKLSDNFKSLFENSNFEFSFTMILFLIVITFAQYLITIISTLGLMSLLGFVVNQLLYSIIFVLIIISCHQSLLIYKNLLISYRENIMTNNENQQALKISINETTQKILMPNLFALITTIMSYSIIGLTSSFNSISIYCSFISMCLFLNFIGQLALYIPSLILQLKRETPIKLSDEIINQTKLPSKVCDEFHLLTEAKSLSKLPKTINTSFTNTTETKSKTVSQSKISLAYNNTKLKYFIFVLFVSYSTMNLVLIVNKLETNLPLGNLMPSQSYLNKHYQNHQNYFGIGPMVMISFMKPFNYSNNETLSKINSFINDAQHIKSISKFTLSWLQATSKNQYIAHENHLCNSDKECFFLGLSQTIGEDTYLDDVNIVNITDNNKLVKSSRIYLQFSKFTGAYDELEDWDTLQALAEEKYNFDKNTLVIFSSIYAFFEQLREIAPSVSSIFILSVESIFFGSLFLVFDLRSIFIQICIAISLVFSLLSNLYIFNLSLNIVTLFQLIMLPALLFEFLFYTVYLYLFNTNVTESNQISLNELKQTTNEFRSSSSESSTDEIEDLNKDAQKQIETPVQFSDFSNDLTRNKNIKFVMKSSTNITFVYLIMITMLSLSLMYNCTTYNFHSLFLILTITCVNILIHLCLFYPNLLNLFGTSWKTIYSERL